MPACPKKPYESHAGRGKDRGLGGATPPSAGGKMGGKKGRRGGRGTKSGAEGTGLISA